MARPLRPDFAGAVWHLTSRGNAGDDIFYNDEDHLDFLELLAEAKRRFNWLTSPMYRLFVHDRVNGSPCLWKNLAEGIYLGSEEWRAQIQRRIGAAPRCDEHPKGKRYVAMGWSHLRHGLVAPATRVGRNCDTVVVALRQGRVALQHGGCLTATRCRSHRDAVGVALRQRL
jgi:hypothetical protein